VTDSIKLVAADDHRLFLEGLKSLFAINSEYNLTAVCEDGDALLALIADHTPNVALIDISMPGANTETIVETVEADFPDTHLIALTMHLDPEMAEELFSLGLSGYVLKDEAFDELSNAIQAVMKGDQFISPVLAKAISDKHRKSQSRNEFLTIREVEVLENAAKGHSNKEIARTLDISERTVRFHVSNCCVKLEAQGRSNAVAKAMQMDLIQFDT
jgi:DNA-binding NarL/FixJ family response regulator